MATLRSTGRKIDETRSIHCEFGKLSKTSGSAIFQIGNTKVAAAINGPHHVIVSIRGV